MSQPTSVREQMASVAASIENDKSSKTVSRPAGESNKFMDRAKQLVVDNYNSHHDSSQTPALTTELVYVVWFSRTLDHWKAIVDSPVVKGLLYEVTHNGVRNESYIDVYKKINHVRVND